MRLQRSFWSVLDIYYPTSVSVGALLFKAVHCSDVVSRLIGFNEWGAVGACTAHQTIQQMNEK